MTILIKEIRIRNFRSLQKVDVTLEELTVLVGQNNSGKTSLLNILHLALGTGYKKVWQEDIFIKKDEEFSKDKKAFIDILIIPVDKKKNQISDFDDLWTGHWGTLVNFDNNDKASVALRTTIKYDTLKDDFILNHDALSEWSKNSDDIEQISKHKKVQVNYLKQFHYILWMLREISKLIYQTVHLSGARWYLILD